MAPATTPRVRSDAAVAFVLAVLSAAVAAGWIAVARMDMTGDAYIYAEAAGNMLRGAGFLVNGLHTAFWNPGYSFTLVPLFAAFGQSPLTVAGLNIALHALSGVLVYLLARRLLPSQSAAIIVTLLAAVVPDKLYFTASGTAENLAVPLVLAALVSWDRLLRAEERRARVWLSLALGAEVGALVLTRAAAQFLPIAFLLLMLWAWGWRRTLLPAAVMVAACALVIAPWVVRNIIVLGSPVITTNGGMNLLVARGSDPLGSFDLAALAPTMTAIVPRDEVAIDREYRRRAMELARRHPERELRLYGVHLKGTFVTDVPAGDTRSWRDVLSAALVPFRVALAVLTLVALVLGIRRRGDFRASVAAVCIAWIALHLVLAPMGSIRFVVPVLLPMLVVSASLLWEWAGALRQRASAKPSN